MKTEAPMRIVTQRDIIRCVAGRWAQQYRHAIADPKDSPWPDGRTKKSVHEELKALDPEKATTADVDRIIGNGSWTTLRCDECGEQTDLALCLGEHGYESAAYDLCAKCVLAAFALWETRSP